MTTRHRFCHEIVVDQSKNEIRMDGVAFPYWTQPDPEIELPKGDGYPIGVLHIGVYADSVVYIGKEGGETRLLEPTPASELEWARRRAEEIVYEGLSDVIQWLARCELDRQRDTFKPMGFTSDKGVTP